MSRTLLIVDDHAGFRAAARALLDAEPFTVIGEAATGGEGLAEVARLRPEIVLLDVHLPDRDGFEVAELLARSPRPPHVLLTSSRSLGDVRARVAASGAVGFLSKDQLSLDSLERALHR